MNPVNITRSQSGARHWSVLRDLPADAGKPRVVLVNPAWEFRTGNVGALPDLYPPLGLGCIAAVLREDGFPVTIVDMPIERMTEDELMGVMEAARPEIIGLTSVTMTYPTVVRLARRFRVAFPGVPILVGGVHITDAPAEVLSEKCFDYSVASEGEIAALTLCRALHAGEVPGDIPGVGYHQVAAPYRNPPDNIHLDDLPPVAYDLYNMEKYLTTYQRMSIITSRGCNARCIFCSAGYALPRVKFLPIERVMAELRYLVKDIGFRFINIYDSNFTYKNEHVMEICDRIIAEGLHFRWRCFSKVNGVTLELFQKMKAAGCSHVLFGVESSHDRTLVLIKKGNLRHHIVEAFDLARQAGLKRIAYSIVGLPGESRQDVLETIDFIDRLEPDFNVVSPISLMPGTPLYERMDEYQMTVLEADWSKGSRNEATACNSLLSVDDIQELSDYAYARLNKGRSSYEWHKEADPGECPYISMMTYVDPVAAS